MCGGDAVTLELAILVLYLEVKKTVICCQNRSIHKEVSFGVVVSSVWLLTRSFGVNMTKTSLTNFQNDRNLYIKGNILSPSTCLSSTVQRVCEHPDQPCKGYLESVLMVPL